MILRKGSSLLSTVLTIAAVSAAGAAGVMTLTGNGLCSLGCGSCGDTDTPVVGQTVMVSAAGEQEADSCCPLCTSDKTEAVAKVTPASDASSCSDKANCGGCSDAQVMQVAAAADKSSCCSGCGDKASTTVAVADKAPSEKASCCGGCGSKAAMVMAAANAESSCCGGCGDKASTTMAASDKADCGASSCGSSCGGGVIAVASSKLGCDDGHCAVSTFATRFAAFRTLLASATTNAGSDCCGECTGDNCADVCGDACAGEGCTKGEALPAMASANGAATGHMLAGGLVIPAMFYAEEQLDRSSLEKASCCGGGCSDKGACSDKAECGEGDACCEGCGSKQTASIAG